MKLALALMLLGSQAFAAAMPVSALLDQQLNQNNSGRMKILVSTPGRAPNDPRPEISDIETTSYLQMAHSATTTFMRAARPVGFAQAHLEDRANVAQKNFSVFAIQAKDADVRALIAQAESAQNMQNTETDGVEMMFTFAVPKAAKVDGRNVTGLTLQATSEDDFAGQMNTVPTVFAIVAETDKNDPEMGHVLGFTTSFDVAKRALETVRAGLSQGRTISSMETHLGLDRQERFMDRWEANLEHETGAAK